MKYAINRAIILTSLLLTPSVLLAQQWGRGDYGPHMGWGNGMFFGPVITLLLLVIVVVIVVSLVRWLSGDKPKRSQTTNQSPLDILRERFAKGEIDKAEYEERRRILEE